MSFDIHESINIAIQDYLRRHDWELPAKIVMSKEAFMDTLSREFFSLRGFPETYRGIPVSIALEDKGMHIHLCEPDINLFPEINANTIKPYKEEE